MKSAIIANQGDVLMTTNKKKLLLTDSMAASGQALLAARDDIETVLFPHMMTGEPFQALLAEHAPVSGVALGATRMGAPELDASQSMAVVSRIGVGYDAIDVPALTAKKIPLMIAGTANSPSVAEQAFFMMMWLAKRSSELDTIVKQNKWSDRLDHTPFDVLGKTVLVVGFGRIGTRTAKRCAAFEMNVLIYDPYKPDKDILDAGYTPVSDLEAAIAQSDFITLHCPKTPETVGLMNAARLSHMKPTSYLVNTARGGIVDEDALHAALLEGRLAGAGLDVFAQEPVDPNNPLLKLDNVITSPHMAGVTEEARDRMSAAAAKNILSVFDGATIRENVVNQEIFG